MKILKIQFLITIFLCSCGWTFGQQLPPGAKAYLNKTYKGWSPTARANDCSSDFAKSVLAGDLDGDGRRDYVVKFIRGKRGYIVALFKRGPRYEGQVLQDVSFREMQNMGMNLGRKGEKYPIGGDPPDVTYGRLPHDAPIIGPCASDAVGFYIYKNGRLRPQ